MLWLWLTTALAETVPDATLLRDTELTIRVHSAGDYILWHGGAGLVVTTPDGVRSTLAAGGRIATTQAGTWTASPVDDEASGWKLAVSPTGSWGYVYSGLVSSTAWHLAADTPADLTFFVPVPLGRALDPAEAEVRPVRAELSGVQGEAITISASTQGDGRSVAEADVDPPADLPLYLDHPNHYNDNAVGYDVRFDALSYSGACGAAGAGRSVTATADADSHGHLVLGCDVDRDGDIDLSGEVDRIVTAAMAPGRSAVAWDGTDRDGAPLPAGSYDCELIAVMSPIHLQVLGANAADPGVQLFGSLVAGTQVQAETMHWDDSAVDEGTETHSGEPGLVHSGTGGVTTRRDRSATLCTASTAGSCDSHGWGADGEGSRGSGAWIDTWSADALLYLEGLTVEVLDDSDPDGDGLSTADERCLVGTDPDDGDSDGDGLGDGEEAGDPAAPTDTDADGAIDPLDPDDDGDTRPTADEVRDAAQHGHDVDGDGAPNWLDTDSDGDGVLDEDEPEDDDLDGIPDYLDDTFDPPAGHTAFDADAIHRDAAALSAQGILSGGAFACSASAGGSGSALLVLLGLLGATRRTARWCPPPRPGAPRPRSRR